jgi:hypothetical protein
MISMFLTINNRTSSSIENLQVDALNKQAIVTFKEGNTYLYDNVSTRAIVNLIFNPDVSLGFWVNNNLVKSERAFVSNKAADYADLKDSNTTRIDEILSNPDYPMNDKKLNLPSFV